MFLSEAFNLEPPNARITLAQGSKIGKTKVQTAGFMCLTLVRLDDARVCVRVGHPKMPCFIIISPVAIFVGGNTTMSFKLR
jgi:hypothetical protein